MHDVGGGERPHNDYRKVVENPHLLFLNRHSREMKLRQYTACMRPTAENDPITPMARWSKTTFTVTQVGGYSPSTSSTLVTAHSFLVFVIIKGWSDK